MNIENMSISPKRHLERDHPTIPPELRLLKEVRILQKESQSPPTSSKVSRKSNIESKELR